VLGGNFRNHFLPVGNVIVQVTVRMACVELWACSVPVEPFCGKVTTDAADRYPAVVTASASKRPQACKLILVADDCIDDFLLLREAFRTADFRMNSFT